MATPHDCPFIGQDDAVKHVSSAKFRWDIIITIVINVALVVYFMTSSQGLQDVKLESHEQRIGANEKQVSELISQRIAVAEIKVQMAQMSKGQDEIKHLIEEMNAGKHLAPSGSGGRK